MIEILIVVVILVIFLVVGLFLFSKRISQSRDAVRKGDLVIMQSALDDYYMNNGSYLEPANYVQIKDSSSSNLWKQGEFGEDFKKTLNLFKMPKDPNGSYYGYSLTNSGSKYQLKAVNDEQIKQKLGDETYAMLSTTSVIGSYNGFLVSNAGSSYYLRSLPGLFLWSGTQISVGNANIFEDGKSIKNTTTTSRVDVSDYFGQDVNKYEAVLLNVVTAFQDKIKDTNQAMAVLKSSAGGKELWTSPFNIGSTAICGNSNGQILSASPTANLCEIGTNSSVTTNASVGTYTWTCSGLSGGMDTKCNAYLNTVIGDDTTGRRRPDSNFPAQCKSYKSATSPYASSTTTGSYWINMNSGGNMSGAIARCDMDSVGPYLRSYDTGYTTIQNTPLLLQASDTDGSTSFVNESFNTSTSIAVVGNTKYSIENPKLGITSIKFDGVSGLKVTSSTNFDFGASTFSIDFWVNFKDASRKEILMMYSTWTGSNSATRYIMHNKSYLSFGFSTGGNTWAIQRDIDWYPSTNAWYHIMIMKNTSNTLKLFIDGKKIRTEPLDGSIFTATRDKFLMIGKDNYGVYPSLQGYMDEIRVMKGPYLWDDEFNVPDRKYRIKE